MVLNIDIYINYNTHIHLMYLFDRKYNASPTQNINWIFIIIKTVLDNISLKIEIERNLQSN